MLNLCRLIFGMAIDLLRSQVALEAEILVLRQQINVLRRANPKRLRFVSIDRLILGGVCRLFPKMYGALAIVRPETVIRCGEHPGSMASFSSLASMSARPAWPNIWCGGGFLPRRDGGRSFVTMLMGLPRWTCSWCRQSRFGCSMAC